MFLCFHTSAAGQGVESGQRERFRAGAHLREEAPPAVRRRRGPAGRIGLGRRRLAEQPTQVDELPLGCRPLLQFGGTPFPNEIMRGYDLDFADIVDSQTATVAQRLAMEHCASRGHPHFLSEGEASLPSSRIVSQIAACRNVTPKRTPKPVQ